MKALIGKILLIACLVVGLAVAGGNAHAAQPVPTAGGTLTGKVTIAGTRTAIVGATVTAVGGAGTFTAVTNSRGTYTMVMPAGTYTVTCAATGYNSATASATVKDAPSRRSTSR
jgi:hypothetical protein